jgi:hypothetical protein
VQIEPVLTGYLPRMSNGYMFRTIPSIVYADGSRLAFRYTQISSHSVELEFIPAVNSQSASLRGP